MNTTVEESVEDEVTTETSAPEALKTPPSLDLNDLALLLNLVNTAMKRGAYEREELRTVLDNTDKLAAFLQFQAQAQKAAQEAAKEDESEGEA
jgi:hypothetical protein